METDRGEDTYSVAERADCQQIASSVIQCSTNIPSSTTLKHLQRECAADCQQRAPRAAPEHADAVQLPVQLAQLARPGQPAAAA